MSAMTNLFSAFAFAAAGAAGLAFSLTHPGVFASSANRILEAAGLELNAKNSPAAEDVNSEPARSSPDTVTLRAGDYGHFNTDVEVNGRTIGVMVDTGASLVALTYEDAERAGIYVRPSDFNRIAQTANGSAKVAPVTIDRIEIGGLTVRNVPAVVSEAGNSQRTLLGMSFLSRLSRVEMRAGMLVLQQ